MKGIALLGLCLLGAGLSQGYRHSGSSPAYGTDVYHAHDVSGSWDYTSPYGGVGGFQAPTSSGYGSLKSHYPYGSYDHISADTPHHTYPYGSGAIPMEYHKSAYPYGEGIKMETTHFGGYEKPLYHGVAYAPPHYPAVHNAYKPTNSAGHEHFKPLSYPNEHHTTFNNGYKPHLPTIPEYFKDATSAAEHHAIDYKPTVGSVHESNSHGAHSHQATAAAEHHTKLDKYPTITSYEKPMVPAQNLASTSEHQNSEHKQVLAVHESHIQEALQKHDLTVGKNLSKEHQTAVHGGYEPHQHSEVYDHQAGNAATHYDTKPKLTSTTTHEGHISQAHAEHDASMVSASNEQQHYNHGLLNSEHQPITTESKIPRIHAHEATAAAEHQRVAYTATVAAAHELHVTAGADVKHEPAVSTANQASVLEIPNQEIHDHQITATVEQHSVKHKPTTTPELEAHIPTAYLPPKESKTLIAKEQQQSHIPTDQHIVYQHVSAVKHDPSVLEIHSHHDASAKEHHSIEHHTVAHEPKVIAAIEEIHDHHMTPAVEQHSVNYKPTTSFGLEEHIPTAYLPPKESKSVISKEQNEHHVPTDQHASAIRESKITASDTSSTTKEHSIDSSAPQLHLKKDHHKSEYHSKDYSSTALLIKRGFQSEHKTEVKAGHESLLTVVHQEHVSGNDLQHKPASYAENGHSESLKVAFPDHSREIAVLLQLEKEGHIASGTAEKYAKAHATIIPTDAHTLELESMAEKSAGHSSSYHHSPYAT